MSGVPSGMPQYAIWYAISLWVAMGVAGRGWMRINLSY